MQSLKRINIIIFFNSPEKRTMNKAIEYKKIIQALNFFAIKENGKINKLKALKLIWLSDRLHLRKYGRTVTTDVYYAMDKGPVPSNAKNYAENNSSYSEPLELEYSKQFIEREGKHEYKSINDVDEKIFSESDIDVMSIIYNEFGSKNRFELVEFSHFYPEWKRFENDLKNKDVARFQMDFLDFFKNPEIENSSIFNQNPELLEISQEDFRLIIE